MAEGGSPRSENSGGWSEEEQEDLQEAQQFDDELERRAADLAARRARGDWCQCTMCFPVGHANSLSDVTCSHESDAALVLCAHNKEFRDANPYNCITHHPSFYHFCLYEHHLRNLRQVYNRAGYNPQGATENEKLRFTAYCSYTVWVHGYLGRRNRREVPQCVMKIIRGRFPDPAAHYRGFQQPPDE